MTGHHKNARKPRCAMKIDLMKAYGSVKWDFILRVMEFIGFPDLLRSWVSKCFTTAQFSLNLNCSLVGFFKSEKELRQEDPISPDLFLPVMEVFAALVDFKIKEYGFDFHP